MSDVKRLELELARYKMASDAARRALVEEQRSHAATIRECDALKAKVRELEAERDADRAAVRALIKALPRCVDCAAIGISRPSTVGFRGEIVVGERGDGTGGSCDEHFDDGAGYGPSDADMQWADPLRAVLHRIDAWSFSEIDARAPFGGCDTPDDHEVDEMHAVAEDNRDTWGPDGAPTSGRMHLYGHAPGCLPGETPAGDWACVPGCPKLGGDEQAFRGILAGTKWPATEEERRHEEWLRQARQEAWERPAVAPEVLRERSPRPPDELVGSLHDIVHRESGKLRMAIPLSRAAASADGFAADTTSAVARAVESLELSLRAMDHVDADGAREGAQLAHDVLTEWLKEDLRRSGTEPSETTAEPRLDPEERHLLEAYMKRGEAVHVANKQRARFLVEDCDGEILYWGAGPTPVIVEAEDENDAVSTFRRWVTRLRMQRVAPGDYQCKSCGKAMEMREGVCSSQCGMVTAT